MPQEAGECTRQGEAEGGEEGGGWEGNHSECHRGDESDAAREAIEPVDEVHGVLHAENPEEGEGQPDRIGDEQVARAERIRQDRNPNAERNRYCRNHHLTNELPACSEIETVVGQADEASEKNAQEECGDPRDWEWCATSEAERRGKDRHCRTNQEERERNGEAASARHQRCIDASLIWRVGKIERYGHTAHQLCADEGNDCRQRSDGEIERSVLH